MSLNDNKINDNDLPKAFAEYFENKITQIVSNAEILNTVYNWTKKVDHPNTFFMTDTDKLECLKIIKIKDCDGFDRIPQSILVDGANVLINPLKELFRRIYLQN